jgi:probable HAF family extracellular repeat protein
MTRISYRSSITDERGRGINDLGQIVGNYRFYDSSNNRRQHACLYQNGSMIDLNDLLPPNSGWELHSANKINNKGQICGYGTHNGLTRAFLMTLPPALVPDGGGGTGNHAPVANDGSVTTNENTPVSVALSATDADGDTLSYSIVSNPTHGSLSGSGANRTYTPAPWYIGGDSFTFKAADPSGAMSNTATVSIDCHSPPSTAQQCTRSQ